jgi:hypothetical protein
MDNHTLDTSVKRVKAEASLYAFHVPDHPPVRATLEFTLINPSPGSVFQVYPILNIIGEYHLPLLRDECLRGPLSEAENGHFTVCPQLYRARNLWEQNCLELFWGFEGDTSYFELNLSLAAHLLGAWNLYEFTDYRTPEPPQDSQAFDLISLKIGSESLAGAIHLIVRFELARAKLKSRESVLESRSKLISDGASLVSSGELLRFNPTLIWGEPQKFFAPSHAEQPDFHRRALYLKLSP